MDELVRGTGFRVVGRTAFNVLPDPQEAAFRTRNLKGALATVGKLAGGVSSLMDKLPGASRTFGRLQFLCLEKPA